MMRWAYSTVKRGDPIGTSGPIRCCLVRRWVPSGRTMEMMSQTGINPRCVSYRLTV